MFYHVSHESDRQKPLRREDRPSFRPTPDVSRSTFESLVYFKR
jgi:hypothetical protein